MARIASTTTSGQPVDPTGGMTLDALMARQKQLAEQGQQIAAPRQMTSPWQGLAAMAQQLVNARQESATQNQMTAGRQALAQAVSGIDPNTGAVPQASIATAMSLDPDTGLKLLQTSLEARRAERERQQHLADVSSQRAYETSQPLTEIGKIDQELAAGRITQQEADTAKAALAPVSFRPPTQAEIDAYKLNPNLSYRINSKTGAPEAIGSPLQLVTPEVSARLGLATNFMNQYDNVLKEVDAGNLTGTGYIGSVMFGRGTGGDAYRTIQAGSDALLRNLTGAGMPQSEADKYVKRYEPGMTDDAATLHNKIAGLKTDLDNVTAAVTAGRQWLPPGYKPGSPTPAPGTTAAPPAATPAPAASGTAAPPAARPVPKVGDVVEGFVFTGGDPNDPRSYKPQQQQGAP